MIMSMTIIVNNNDIIIINICILIISNRERRGAGWGDSVYTYYL